MHGNADARQRRAGRLEIMSNKLGLTEDANSGESVWDSSIPLRSDCSSSSIAFLSRLSTSLAILAWVLGDPSNSGCGERLSAGGVVKPDLLLTGLAPPSPSFVGCPFSCCDISSPSPPLRMNLLSGMGPANLLLLGHALCKASIRMLLVLMGRPERTRSKTAALRMFDSPDDFLLALRILPCNNELKTLLFDDADGSLSRIHALRLPSNALKVVVKLGLPANTQTHTHTHTHAHAHKHTHTHTHTHTRHALRNTLKHQGPKSRVHRTRSGVNQGR